MEADFFKGGHLQNVDGGDIVWVRLVSVELAYLIPVAPGEEICHGVLLGVDMIDVSSPLTDFDQVSLGWRIVVLGGGALERLYQSLAV